MKSRLFSTMEGKIEFHFTGGESVSASEKIRAMMENSNDPEKNLKELDKLLRKKVESFKSQKYSIMMSQKKSLRWGNRTVEEISSVAHLEDDFSHGFARLISPVQENELESLESQMNAMSVETKAQAKTNKKKRTIMQLRKLRQELH